MTFLRCLPSNLFAGVNCRAGNKIFSRFSFGTCLPLALTSMLFMSAAAPVRADQCSDEIKLLRAQAVEAQLQGKFGIALDDYEKAIKTAIGAYGPASPFIAEIYYDAGTMCLAASNFGKAEEYLSQTIKLNPNSSSAHLRMAELKRLQGRPDEAAKQAAAVIAKHHDDAVAHQELALAYENNEDKIRAYREYSTVERLIEQGSDNTFSPVTFSMPLFAKPKTDDKAAEYNAAQDKAASEARKKAEDMKKNAEKAKAEAKKVEQEMKKMLADAKKKADQEKKKAEDKRKAEQAKKNADKKKAEVAKAKPGKSPTGEESTLSGLPASLHSKAVLLTPVGKKKPAASESSSAGTVEPKKQATHAKPAPTAEPDETSADTESEVEKSAPPPKKAKPVEQKAEPKKIQAPKAGKHAPGLVPPPPPVVPTYPIMVPVQQPPPKPKPLPPKKVEEKPKEQAKEQPSSKEPEDDDFLLDWGGANKKKKK